MTWISVKDRLPEQQGVFLVCCRSIDGERRVITTAWYYPEQGPDGWSLIAHIQVSAVTHWIAVPPPPEDEVWPREEITPPCPVKGKSDDA